MMTITLNGVDVCRSVIKVIILVYMIALAVYDIRHKRVPNAALLILLPIAAAGCTIDIWLAENCWSEVGSMLLGAIAGGGILLGAAMATGGGIGGGDIKLMAVIGIAAGLSDTLLILLLACVLALIYGAIKRAVTGDKNLRLAFVPFLTVGYMAAVIPTFI